MSESENASDFSKMDEAPETGDSPAAPCTQVSDKHTAADASSASHTSAIESALTQESQTQTPNQSEALRKRAAEAAGSPSGMLNNPAAPVTPTLTSAAMTPTLKVMVSSAPVRCTTPLVVGASVASAAWARGQTSLTRFGGRGVMSNQVRPPAVTPTPHQAATMALPRTSPQTVTVPQSPQARSLQLPANFQIPQGMVLIHNGGGQLMLVSQQALAQAKGFMPKSSNITTAVRPQASQATTTSVIRVSIPSPSTTLATIVKPTSLTENTVLKPSSTMGTTMINPPTIGSTIIKQPSGLGTGIKPNPITGPTVIKATSAQNPPIRNTTATMNQRTITTITNIPMASVEKSTGTTPVPSSVTQSDRPAGIGPRIRPPNIPIKENSSIKVSSLVTVTAETMENVKKCRNFLVTLMKLTSSGTASGDVAQNVRALVKDVLVGQLEAEEFTEKLYKELKSSPQQYLVPFLKKSLPAMRQFTPNPQLFVQQCEPPKASSSSTISSNTQKPGLSSSTISQPTQGSVPARSPEMVFQPTKGVITNQRMTASPLVVLPAQKCTQLKQAFIQTNTQGAGTFRKPYFLQACKTTSRQTQAAEARVFKGSTSGSFRDDDDINDVASMAGVNVNEETARILASSSQLVGAVVRSCRDEFLLQTAALQQRVLHIGNSLGVTEANPDVLGLLSHATQERLRNLLEKLMVVAHHNISYKDDWRYIQTSDARSQLKFLAQLEKVEKQRREEQEKETLLRIAKSRSNSEDPEQLRLKQRAKEMQQLELAQTAHRDANLAALAALGPRKRTFLEASSSGTSQVPGARAPRTIQQLPNRVTFRDLIFCMEQDHALKHSLKLYSAFLH